MPWTLAHPAAILPLRRAAPKYLDFAALVIGSMTPDLGYYIDRSDLSTFAHTFWHSLGYDVLPGFALYALFVAARKPICLILPMPHRGALWPVCVKRFRFSAGHLLAIAVSLLLGAWTHIAWDGFTHRTGWFVQEVPVLRDAAVSIGVAHLAGYTALQHLSSLFGIVVLAIAYWRWLVRQPPPSTQADAAETWRYALCAAILALSIALACVLGFYEQPPFGSYRALRLFVFSVLVNLITVGVPLVLVVAALVYAWRREPE